MASNLFEQICFSENVSTFHCFNFVIQIISFNFFSSKFSLSFVRWTKFRMNFKNYRLHIVVILICVLFYILFTMQHVYCEQQQKLWLCSLFNTQTSGSAVVIVLVWCNQTMLWFGLTDSFWWKYWHDWAIERKNNENLCRFIERIKFVCEFIQSHRKINSDSDLDLSNVYLSKQFTISGKKRQYLFFKSKHFLTQISKLFSVF